jgi:hypothetical protein
MVINLRHWWRFGRENINQLYFKRIYTQYPQNVFFLFQNATITRKGRLLHGASERIYTSLEKKTGAP